MESRFKDKTPIVLIVDDNPNNVKVIAVILRQLNYKLVIATSGKSAIELVEKTRPDLILLDIMMPEMDGYETCEIIKSDPKNKNLPIIFLTALNEKENIVKGFEKGGVDYITKPFNKDELISRVKTHLELKFTRDELQETTNHLTDLNALKDKMFSVIGHDLRSPLGSVQMTLELLSQDIIQPGDEDYKETIDLLKKTTDEVYSLLENLLGWAKSQSGNLTVEPESLKLLDVVNSIFLLHRGNLNLKQIEFENKVDTDITALADLNTIKVVLRNIVSNAIKFTPEKGKITIDACQKDNHVEVSVTDSGVGIPEENIPKLFDSKKHLTTYGTNRESGSGLGLVLCKNFIEKNNGEVWVESEVGNGTTFYFSLPLAN